jgi:hypothetical protein
MAFHPNTFKTSDKNFIKKKPLFGKRGLKSKNLPELRRLNNLTFSHARGQKSLFL